MPTFTCVMNKELTLFLIGFGVVLLALLAALVASIRQVLRKEEEENLRK